MARPTTLTDEQRKANLFKIQKKYRDKVMSYYHDYPNLKECYHYAIKCLRRSVIINGVLLITAVLWRMF